MIFVNSTAYSVQYTAYSIQLYSIQYTAYSLAWGTLTIAKRYLSIRHTVYSCTTYSCITARSELASCTALTQLYSPSCLLAALGSLTALAHRSSLS